MRLENEILGCQYTVRCAPSRAGLLTAGHLHPFLVLEDLQEGVVLVPARRMYGHARLFLDNKHSISRIAVEDLDPARDDRRLVPV